MTGISAGALILAVSGPFGTAHASNRTAIAGQAPSAVTVSMKEFSFKPATIHVPAGATVTWTYDETASDPTPNCESPEFHVVPGVNCPGHSTTSATVVNEKPLWDSGVHRANGFPYSVQFAMPGSYPYYCVVHGGAHPNNPITHMNGVIVVDPTPARTANSSTTSTTQPAASHSAASSGSGGTLTAANLPHTGPPDSPAPLPVAAAVLAGVGVVGLGLRRRVTNS